MINGMVGLMLSSLLYVITLTNLLLLSSNANTEHRRSFFFAIFFLTRRESLVQNDMISLICFLEGLMLDSRLDSFIPRTVLLYTQLYQRYVLYIPYYAFIGMIHIFEVRYLPQINQNCPLNSKYLSLGFVFIHVRIERTKIFT